MHLEKSEINIEVEGKVKGVELTSYLPSVKLSLHCTYMNEKKLQ